MLNQDWFAAEFKAAGHNVYSVGLADNLDLQLDRPLYHISQVLDRLPEKFTPDVLVLHDNSAPISITGIEELSCLKIFYAVDTHHHAEMHCYISEMFDYTFVAHKDYLKEWSERGLPTPEWMPLWAPCYVEPSAERQYGAVFVGTLNAKLNPERVTFFEELGKLVPILCKQGDYKQIFPYSDLVVNQTVKGDLNFRVFETMMCGSCLLTERSGNGLEELFTPGVHLLTYEKNNVAEAAEIIQKVLDDPAETRAMAKAGREEILRAHTPAVRAQRMMQVIEGLKERPDKRPKLAAMVNMHQLATRLNGIDTTLAVCAHAESMKLLEAAIAAVEKMDNVLSFYATRSALEYDRKSGLSGGAELLKRCFEVYPGMDVFVAARVRALLNQGQVQEAKKLVSELFACDADEAFRMCEHVIGEVFRAMKDA